MIHAGDPLPSTLPPRTFTTPNLPLRLDVDLGTPSASTLQPIATRTGTLHHQAFQVGGTSAAKKAKHVIEIVPLAATRYSPGEDEPVIGVIVQKTYEYFTVDINSEFGHANLKTLEF